MKNFKINKNREPLTEADLSSGKDFGRLMQAYQAAKVPLFKTAKFWFGALSVMVTAITALVIYTKVIAPDSFATDGVEQATFINPPMPQADIKREMYAIAADKDTIIAYTTGSQIRIPANAFLDAQGKVVSGKVQLHYREFHDAIDVLLAGIPMTYDSAGQQYHFETAGMMEISATQNGKALHTNPDAPINVDMVSNDSRDVFNSYYLDTVKKEWEYIARANYTGRNVNAVNDDADSIASSTEAVYENSTAIGMQQELREVKAEIKILEAKKPIEPKKINKDKPRFSIKVDEQEFPEIAIYKGMKFQVVDIAQYDEKKANIMWEEIKMKRIDNSLNYEITFSNARTSYSIAATPVFDTKEYSEAKKIYDAKFEAYEITLAKKQKEEAELKAKLSAQQREAQEAMQKEVKAQQLRQQEYEAKLQQSSLVYRTFQINSFGIYNCDRPQILPTAASVVAKFTDAKTGEKLSCQNVYLVEKGRNLVYSYFSDSFGKFMFDPTKENMVWVVTNDLKVAIIKPTQFSAAVEGKKEAVFAMEVLEKPFKNTAEAKAYLEI